MEILDAVFIDWFIGACVGPVGKWHWRAATKGSDAPSPSGVSGYKKGETQCVSAGWHQACDISNQNPLLGK